jgi:DNA-binding NarL/FixJ family response regulator
MNNGVEWRRSKVQELGSQGYNLSEISRTLQISQPTINRDITYLGSKLNITSKDTLMKDRQKNMRNVLLN